MEPEREHEKREQESHEDENHKKGTVIISVNRSQPVKPRVTLLPVLRIKAAAIAQGCTSSKNFVLQEGFRMGPARRLE